MSHHFVQWKEGLDLPFLHLPRYFGHSFIKSENQKYVGSHACSFAKIFTESLNLKQEHTPQVLSDVHMYVGKPPLSKNTIHMYHMYFSITVKQVINVIAGWSHFAGALILII
jgi:hypothetical protein